MWDAVKEAFDLGVHTTMFVNCPLGTAVVVFLHYNRNELNESFSEEELLPDHKPLSENEDKFHQNNQRGGRNRKYVIGEWFSSEQVFYADGTLNTTPEDEGTVNVYFGDNAFLNFTVHGLFDVAPYMIWGNSPDDSTTIIDRILLALG